MKGFWKVNYELNGKKDCVWYGGLTPITEVRKRNKKLRELGYKILSCYPVKTAN